MIWYAVSTVPPHVFMHCRPERCDATQQRRDASLRETITHQRRPMPTCQWLHPGGSVGGEGGRTVPGGKPGGGGGGSRRKLVKGIGDSWSSTMINSLRAVAAGSSRMNLKAAHCGYAGARVAKLATNNPPKPRQW